MFTDSRRTERVYGAFVLLLIAGCNPVSGVIDEHRSAAEAKLRALEALREPATATPRATANTLAIGDRAKLKFSSFGGPEDWNAAVIRLEALSDLTVDGIADIDPGTDPFWWWGSACLLRNEGKWTNGETLSSEATARGVFEDLARVKYVVVVRTASVELPRIETAASEDASGRLVAGRFVGDAQLFALPGGEALGGFPIDASSSTDAATKIDGAQDYDLNTDLKVQVDDVLRAALVGVSAVGGTLGGT